MKSLILEPDAGDEREEQHRLAALFHLARKEYPPALEEIQAALRLDPAEASSHALLAEIYAKMGSGDHSLREFGEAVSLDPGNVDYKLKLTAKGAQVALRRGQLDLAQEWAREGVEIAEKRGASYRLPRERLAETSGANGEEERTEAMRAGPPASAEGVKRSNAAWVYGLVLMFGLLWVSLVLLLASSRVSQAQKHMADILDLYEKTMVARHEGDHATAATLAAQGIETCKTTRITDKLSGFLLMCGRSNVATGQYHNAMPCFREAAALYPSSEAFSGLSACYSALGKYEKALEAQRRAVEIDPNSLSAKVVLFGRKLEALWS